MSAGPRIRPGSVRIEHLLRRMGFGASPGRDWIGSPRVPLVGVIGHLLNFDRVPDGIDAKIDDPNYVGVTTRGQFQPNTDIDDARQRWLFRMVHTRASAAGEDGALLAQPLRHRLQQDRRHLRRANAGDEDDGAKAGRGSPRGRRGQIELFRDIALGNFRDLLVEVAKDPAMLVWLDGRTNVRARPQENFGRELMELFTIGVGHYTEAGRLRRGARLHRLEPAHRRRPRRRRRRVLRVRLQRRTSTTPAAKTFSFPIYPDGGRDDSRRARAADGHAGRHRPDHALAVHPETAERLARRFWTLLRQRGRRRPTRVRRDIARGLPATTTRACGAVVRACSSRRRVPAIRRTRFARYSWPVEFVVRAIKEVGWTGFSVDDALTPLANMGQQLFEPPDVNGWELGPGWFSTAAMLARMNFASALVANQRFNLRRRRASARQTARGAARVRRSSALAGAARSGSRGRRCSTTCARAARGRAPTRSC